MTLHIDLTINGDTIARLSVHNVGPATARPKGTRLYRWHEEHAPGGRSGFVAHLPVAGAVRLSELVLADYDRAGGVPCPK